MTLSLAGAVNNTLASTASSQSISMTFTPQSPGRIIVIAQNETPAGYNDVASVTATGLTFTQRSKTRGLFNESIEVWWADNSSTFNNTITVTWTSTFDDCVIFAFGIQTDHAPIAWDTNSSLPASHVASDAVCQASCSTDSAAPYVLAIFGNGRSSGPTATTMTPSPMAQVDQRVNSGGTNFQVGLWGGAQFSAKVTATSVGWTTNTTTTGLVVVDALKDAPAVRGWVVGAVTLN